MEKDVERLNTTTKYIIYNNEVANSIYKRKINEFEKVQYEMYMNNGRTIEKILEKI